jgi:hypothetical protein
MTTGRINQVTLVKKNKEKKDRPLARPLKKSPILFSSPEQQKNAALDQEVLFGMKVFNPKRCFLRFNHMFVTIIRSQLDNKVLL